MMFEYTIPDKVCENQFFPICTMSTKERNYMFLLSFQTLLQVRQTIFFQNEEIFVQLDELDELDRITHA